MTNGNVRIIVKGEDKTDDILNWNESDGKINITYPNGKTYSYSVSNVQIKRSALSDDMARNRLEYFKRIARVVGLQDSRGGNILVNRYEKIDFVNEDGMLSAFLTGHICEANPTSTALTVYPFGFNMSQKKAVDDALENPLSIIEGPPGTGKTQTILNILANAVMCGESVAIVSSNNSAIANVRDKLKKYEVDFITAYLGNSENKAKFIESQKALPNMASWRLSEEQKSQIIQTLQNLYSALSIMLEKKNRLSGIRQELGAIELEYAHFCDYCDFSEELLLQYLKPTSPSTAALDLWLICEKYVERGKMPGFFGKLANKILRGVTNKAFYSAEPDTMIGICQKRWYIARKAELAATALLLQDELDRFDFKSKMDEYSELSAKLFRDYLANKYGSGERRQFSAEDLWKNSEAFIKEYPVILSTTYSLRSSLSYKVMYDYIIIDEASQVDLATGALALSCAKKAVIVGDLKQLPNVVDSEGARKTDMIFDEFDLPEVYRYKNHSLLSAVLELFSNAPKTLLREHYRCHPKIIEFCNQKFYDNQLIILTEPKSDRKPLAVYRTAAGNHAREHVNQRQIDVIKSEILPQQNLTGNTVSVGIVTPYRNQTNALQEAFAETGILADTVDKYQGRENDVIILSTVDNNISEFTDDANRLNVAVSRAIDQLIVVVNSGDDMVDKNIGDLVRYVEYNNLEIINSEIYSIFDYLYKSYREKRNAFLREHGRISEYESENLMYTLIHSVLIDKRFSRFDVVARVPLRMILRDMEKLDADEQRYAEHYLTHVDFLIFEKIGKVPRYVVEVDGAAFHAAGTRQSQRDDLKNRILEKCKLPYIRFKTDGSRERERLTAALNEVVG